jgi:hypothetical protein
VSSACLWWRKAAEETRAHLLPLVVTIIANVVEQEPLAVLGRKNEVDVDAGQRLWHGIPLLPPVQGGESNWIGDSDSQASTMLRPGLVFRPVGPKESNKIPN